MPLIDNIDGPNRRIYLGIDSVGVEVVPMDIYTEMRALRRTDENLRKFDLFLSGEGKVDKGGGSFTERYVKCLLGTRIVPYDGDHTLVIVSGIITDDGQQGIACFDRSLLTPGTLVDIDYQPPQVEVIEIVTGGGVGTVEEVRDAVWLAARNLYGDISTMGGSHQFLRKILLNKQEINQATNELWIYDDDGNTIIYTADLQDAAGQPSSTLIFKRVPTGNT